MYSVFFWMLVSSDLDRLEGAGNRKTDVVIQSQSSYHSMHLLFGSLDREVFVLAGYDTVMIQYGHFRGGLTGWRWWVAAIHPT